MTKKVRPWMTSALILGLVLLLPWILPLRAHQPEEAQKHEAPGSSSEIRGPSAVSPADQNEAKKPHVTPLRKWIADEAGEMGKPVDKPGDIEERLRRKSVSLVSNEIKSLETLCLDPSVKGDERFLSVELLVMNPTLEAAEALGRIIMSPEARRSPEPALEQMIRARAIEGLGQHPNPRAGTMLQRSLYRVSDKALLERGQRALMARRGQVPSPEEQDRAALRKLTE